MASLITKTMNSQKSISFLICLRRQLAAVSPKTTGASKDTNHPNTKVKEKLSSEHRNTNLLLKYRVLPAVAAGGVAVISAPFVLSAAGFGAGGILAGSAAAKLMSLYGGAVSTGSIVAVLQSAGAAGITAAGNVGVFTGAGLTTAGSLEVGSRIYKRAKSQLQNKTKKPNENYENK